jgi:three-Cys-motif partner protein
VAETVIASDDLPARLIKPQSLDKHYRHAQYCGIFTSSMKDLWPGRLGYLELFAGPGLTILEDARGAVEEDGCPLQAAIPSTRFQRLAFVEYNQGLADALEQRIRRRGLGPDRARVFCGDANDVDVLGEAMDFLPAPGLIFTFIDPEDINGSWDAVKFLNSRRWPKNQRLDFLINLPVGGMKRNPGSEAKITSVLGTDEWIPRVKAGEPLGRVIRETYKLQFERLKVGTAEHKEIRNANGTPIYDLVFASKSPTAHEFWKKISAIEYDGQRTLLG